MRRVLCAILVGLAAGGALGLGVGGPGDVRAEPPREGWPPDPPPVATKLHWVFEIRVQKGEVSFGPVTGVTLDKATATPRMIGRYALELYVGTELLDRLRFNVPLGDTELGRAKRPGLNRPEFRVNTRFFVRIADQPRATTFRLVDRATGDVTTFVWPPNPDGTLTPTGPTPTSTAGDAGIGDGGSPDGSSATHVGPPGGAVGSTGASGELADHGWLRAIGRPAVEPFAGLLAKLSRAHELP